MSDYYANSLVPLPNIAKDYTTFKLSYIIVIMIIIITSDPSNLMRGHIPPVHNLFSCMQPENVLLKWFQH